MTTPYTPLSLAEQLKITERELQERIRLFEITDEDLQRLKRCKGYLTERMDALVELFYQRQLQHPPIQMVIGDSETLARLRKSLRRYILELFDGHFDLDYVNSRLRVGKVHHRIGVPPKLYLAATSLLQEMLEDELAQQCATEGHPPAELAARRASLRKVLHFDTHLVFDTYIANLLSEVQNAKEAVERHATGLEEQIAQRTAQLDQLSRKDILTGLFNQRGFYDLLRQQISRASRHREPLTLAYIDLNGFKPLNDQEGHLAGDRLLELVGDALRESVREEDVPCRYGGDEFCIIMPKTTEEQAVTVCQRLFRKFKAKEHKGISFSVGVAQTGPDDYLHMDDLVKLADGRMYEVKAEAHKKPGNYIRRGVQGL